MNPKPKKRSFNKSIKKKRQEDRKKIDSELVKERISLLTANFFQIMSKLNCTIAQEFKKYLPDHLRRTEKVRSLLIKHGNKARANKFLLTILKLLVKEQRKTH